MNGATPPSKEPFYVPILALFSLVKPWRHNFETKKDVYFSYTLASGLVAVAAIAALFLSALFTTPALADPAFTDLTFVGTHRFESRTSAESLRTTAVFPDPGPASVSLRTGAGPGGQWLVFNHGANGRNGVILKNRAAGLCLDTADGGSSTSVAVRGCDDTVSQDWIIVSVPGTNFQFFTVQNSFTKKYLTKNGLTSVNLQSFSEGNTLQHWEYILDES
jgi:hypothetical protein